MPRTATISATVGQCPRQSRRGGHSVRSRTVNFIGLPQSSPPRPGWGLQRGRGYNGRRHVRRGSGRVVRSRSRWGRPGGGLRRRIKSQHDQVGAGIRTATITPPAVTASGRAAFLAECRCQRPRPRLVRSMCVYRRRMRRPRVDRRRRFPRRGNVKTVQRSSSPGGLRRQRCAARQAGPRVRTQAVDALGGEGGTRPPARRIAGGLLNGVGRGGKKAGHDVRVYPRPCAIIEAVFSAGRMSQH